LTAPPIAKTISLPRSSFSTDNKLKLLEERRVIALVFTNEKQMVLKLVDPIKLASNKTSFIFFSVIIEATRLSQIF
jgi:hypothetical protein